MQVEPTFDAAIADYASSDESDAPAFDGRLEDLADSQHSNAQYGYSPVRQVLKSEATGEEIQQDALMKGYEYAPDKFAVIEPELIKAAAVETSDTIDLFHFVKADEVDPIYFERSYYVASDSGAEKAYTLLLEAMRKDNYFGIARIGMHRREHMLILRPTPECIVADTLFYVNEIRRAPKLNLRRQDVSERELSVASALVKGYAGKFEPEQFTDLYQERIKGIIEAEMSMKDQRTAPALRTQSGVPDLMESIRLSLAQIEEKKRTAKAQPKRPARKSAATGKKRLQKVVA